MVRPAIVVVGYNRLESMKRLLEAINDAEYRDDNIELVISIDYWKKSNSVAEFAKDFEWKHGTKRVITHNFNLGLREHVLQCGDLTNEYESIILLEDDLLVSPVFYDFAQKAISYYQSDDRVVGIGLYTLHYNGYAEEPFQTMQNGFDTYFEKWVITWGQCFMRESWNEFRKWYVDNSGKLDYNDDIPKQITDWPDSSWSKYMIYYMNVKSKWFVSNYFGFSTNFHDEGEHSGHRFSTWQISLLRRKREYIFASYEEAEKYDAFFENYQIEEQIKRKVQSDNVKIDIYGQHWNYEKTRYLLTSQILHNRIIQSYGLILRPQEQNVIDSIPGNDIFLYDLNYKKRNSTKKIKHKIRQLQYYRPLLGRKKALIYAICSKFM